MNTPNLAFWTVAQTGEVVPNTIGTHGTGKSRQGAAFAEAINHGYYDMVCSYREPTDLGGFPYPDHSNGRAVMRFMMPDWLNFLWEEHQKGKPYVLHLDEGTSCPPPAQTAMMRVVHDRKVGENPLPPDTLMIMSCNPPEIAANGFEYEAPMANRLCHLEWEPDWTTWEKGDGQTWPVPSFTRLPNDWKKYIPETFGMIKAFRKHKATAFELSETELKDRSLLSGPHPTMRSWTNGAICMAACKAIHAPLEVVYGALQGCVGDSAGLMFADWERNLDLPDPEELIEGALKANKEGKTFTFPLPPRADQIMACLSSVTARIAHYGNTVERWEAAMAVHDRVADSRQKELAVPEAASLMKVKPPKARISGTFCARIYPLLQAAGYLDQR